MNRKFITVILLFFLSFFWSHVKAETHRPIGDNCNIENPPEKAGEDSHMYGGLFKVYPRAKNISEDYSGCQIVWHAKGDSLENWSLLNIAKFENGSLKYSWSFSGGKIVSEVCEYSNGKLVSGNKSNCIKPEGVPIKSMRPGCFNDFHQAQLDRSLPLPKDCLDYE